MSLFSSIKKIILGNGSAQLIQFAFLPLSAFLYSPEQFGLFGVIQAYSTVLTIFISLQLYVAIPFEKDKADLSNLIKLNFKCIVLFTIFLLILYFIFSIDYFSVLAIFLASITAVTNTLRSLIVYSGNFTKLSVSYVIRALVIVIAQAVLSFNSSVNGLIYGLLLGEIIYSLLLHYFIRKNNSLPKVGLKDFFEVKIKSVFIKYKAFSLHGSILELTSVLIFYGPIIIFSYMFFSNNDYIGQYSFVSRFVWPPIILISTSCASALYFHVTKVDSLELKKLTLKATYLGFLILVLAPVFGWFSQYIFNIFVQNSMWDLISTFGFYIVTMAFVFMATIYSRVIIRYKYLQKYQLLMDVVFLLTLIGVLYFKKVITVFEILNYYTFMYFVYGLLLILGVFIFIRKQSVENV
ncbi:oligosaccharide flippase family protein [Acinetobacter sp. YH01026]|uniref:oligosaccharide flippase family protein n=1 Tax=Acinetobacter sp. YH01026 TaxID=2601039 RepID=UPI0015D43F28